MLNDEVPGRLPNQPISPHHIQRECYVELERLHGKCTEGCQHKGGDNEETYRAIPSGGEIWIGTVKDIQVGKERGKSSQLWGRGAEDN